MKNAFANKMSYFILTFIFLIITASFLFSGYDKFSLGGGKNVATVDGTPVTIREYQNVLGRQIEFYSQLMGGKTLSAKDIEQMGIKQGIINNLIQQKLVANLAGQMGLVVSLDEIKKEIKNLQYFKTNEQFDVNKYRAVLQNNGYSPTQFEELIGNDVRQKKIDDIFNNTLISENFVKDVLSFKNSSVNIHAIKLSRQSLAPLVSISDKEITEYLAKPENTKALEAAYKENEAKYNQPEEVKAKHILIKGSTAESLDKINAIKAKVNTKNFASIADKETEDPSGKKNGGDLPWFSKGKMVPEFEKVAFEMKPGQISSPVKTEYGYHIIYVMDKKAAKVQTLDNVKSELARLAIQKTKAQDLDQLLKSEQEKIDGFFKNNKIAEIEALQKKVDGQFFKSVDVNQYDQTIGQISLSAKEAEQVFKAKAGEVLNFGNPGTIFLVKVNSPLTALDKKIEEQLATEKNSQNQNFSRKSREDLLKNLNNKAKIVTNPSVI